MPDSSSAYVAAAASDRGGGAGKQRAAKIPAGDKLTTPQLRRLVRVLKGCLSSLSTGQAKLLTLRAGIGRSRSLTPRQVARILHVSAERESRLEQQAVAALNTASSSGRCQNPAMSIQNAVGGSAGSILTALAQPALIAPPVASTGGHRSGTTTGSGKGNGAPRRNGSQRSTSHVRSASVAPSGQGGPDMRWLLLLAIAAGLAALWFIAARLRAEPEDATVRGATRALPRGPDEEAVAGGLGLLALRDTRPAERAPAEQPRTRPADTRSSADPPQATSAAPSDALLDAIAALELGGALVEKGDLAGAEAAYRRADEHGHPAAASSLGVVLEQRGDVAGAEAAYRSADERGDATGAFNLGALRTEWNDFDGAEAAFRRADERGDAAGALYHGRLLERRGDLDGAERAFRRADERGHPAGASHLGMRLEQRGDLASAEAAYRRADAGGDATGAFKLGAILEDRNDLPGAEAAYRRAAERGRGYVADLARAALSLLSARR